MIPHYACMHSVRDEISEEELEDYYLQADNFCVLPHFCRNFGETKFGVRCPTEMEIRENSEVFGIHLWSCGKERRDRNRSAVFRAKLFKTLGPLSQEKYSIRRIRWQDLAESFESFDSEFERGVAYGVAMTRAASKCAPSLEYLLSASLSMPEAADAAYHKCGPS